MQADRLPGAYEEENSTMKVSLINGPAGGGKSTVLCTLLENMTKIEPHYLRVTRAGSRNRPPLRLISANGGTGLSSARWLNYTNERIFELLPETIGKTDDDDAHLFIEADSDPLLRAAYPYDHRIFIMPPPTSQHQIMRSQAQVALAIREMLDDSAVFTSEMFGVSEAEMEPKDESHDQREDLSESGVRTFLTTPLGHEVMARVSFQQDYQWILESHAVLVNTGISQLTGVAEAVLHRMMQVINHLPGDSTEKPKVFCCDPCEMGDPATQSFFKFIQDLCASSNRSTDPGDRRQTA